MIDFPLENLDMTPFVLSKHQKENSKLIYDCFAVSNHFGGVGGGHYTAYG
jgi:ubiquitin carboxyl-terminal hydrolase 4/11/15